MVRNILIAFCVILFVSCSKDTESKLFGKWQLQKVEASGDVQNVDTVYFNFEHSLFMYQVYVTEIDSFRHQYGYNTSVHGYVPTALRDKKALLDNHWLADQSLSDGRLYRYGLKERK